MLPRLQAKEEPIWPQASAENVVSEICYKYIRQLGHSRSDSDPCMCILQLADESRIYLILYVDDMVIARSNHKEQR